LIDHPEVYNSIEAKVLAHHNVRRIGIDAPVEATAPTSVAAVKAEGSAPHAAAGATASGKDKTDAKGDTGAPRPTATIAQSSNGKRPNA
jgi:hypothetical protein